MTTEYAKNIINMIITQLNLLLSLVSDVLDMKMIEAQQFQQKFETFSPKSVFELIVAMFQI